MSITTLYTLRTLRTRIQYGIIALACLVVMALFSACAGVAGTSGSNGLTLTGSIQSVNTANHSVTISVSGQTYTISGLSDQQAQALQSQVGKVYMLQVTQNGNTYTINTGTNPQADTNATPGVTTTNTNSSSNTSPFEAGSIEFIGKVQSVNGSNVVIAMPDGHTPTITTNSQTDLSDMNGQQPAVGQMLKVTATANSDGTFTAQKLGLTDSSDQADQNTVTYQGVTSNAVGSDNVIHFTVGTTSYSFPLNSSTDLGDFNNNAQSIAANQSVEVEVLFTGTTGSVTKVSNPNN
jgi:hypothetical protein